MICHRRVACQLRLSTVAIVKVGQALRTLPGIGNVVSNASVLQPELVVCPDAARAAELGVTTPAIAETLRVATEGRAGVFCREIPEVRRLHAEVMGVLAKSGRWLVWL